MEGLDCQFGCAVICPLHSSRRTRTDREGWNAGCGRKHTCKLYRTWPSMVSLALLKDRCRRQPRASKASGATLGTTALIASRIPCHSNAAGHRRPRCCTPARRPRQCRTHRAPDQTAHHGHGVLRKAASGEEVAGTRVGRCASRVRCRLGRDVPPAAVKVGGRNKWS